MASTYTKYQVETQSGPLVETTAAEKPTNIEAKEILVRLKAIAINPADFKLIDGGNPALSWPIVPGLDGAGIVEAVGNGVRNFAIGDRVLAMFMPGDRSGSYQQLAIAPESKVTKIPDTWTFSDAATLGICYHTAVVGLGLGLKTPLPFLRDGPTTGFQPSSVLVLGGSSALGAATIQLLRLVLPDSTILTTSSPKHRTHLTQNLGVDRVFDRTASFLIEDVKSATPGSRGVEAIFDAVGAARNEPRYFSAFDPTGPQVYAQVWTGEDAIPVPPGVNSIMFRSRDAPSLSGGANIMASLQTLLEQDKYRLPLPVRVLGHGLEALQRGLELSRKGVSGEKLVVTV